MVPSLRALRIISPMPLFQLHFLHHPLSFRITLLVHKHSHLSTPSLITPTHLSGPHQSHSLFTKFQPPKFPLHSSVEFRGLPSSCLAELFFPPIGTIWCFSRRLISPALESLKFQATLSSKLITPSPAGAQPLLETRMVEEFSL